MKLSHACVLRRCWEMLGDGRIFQFGIRSGDRTEFEFAAEGHVAMRRFDFEWLDVTLDALKGKPVYLTIDLDVLDPSVFPGTGTPRAGRRELPRTHARRHKGRPRSERRGLRPGGTQPALYDPSGISTALFACKLTRELLLAFMQ